MANANYELERVRRNLANSYEVAKVKGAEIPTQKTFDNLPATIESIPTSIEPPPIPPSTDGWQRPLDRPAVPEIAEGEQVIYELFGVNEHSPNDNAFRITTSAGQYAVDWGDGEITYHNSNTTAEHIYDYSVIDKPVGSEGYKWVWVKIYPISGNLTIINFAQYRHNLRPAGSTSNIFVPQVFEIYMQGQYINSVPFASNFYTRLHLLEVFDFRGTNLITSFTYFGYSWFSLKILNIYTSNGTSFGNFLQNCLQFNNPIKIDTSKGTVFGSFMNSCYSFNKHVNIDTSKGLSFTSFMSSCYSLNQPLTIDLKSATSAIGTSFIGASNYALKSLRLLNMGLIHTSLTISNSSLDVPALVALFGDLADRTSTTTGTITITNVYGASRLTAEERAIATNKNWTIVG